MEPIKFNNILISFQNMVNVTAKLFVRICYFYSNFFNSDQMNYLIMDLNVLIAMEINICLYLKT